MNPADNTNNQTKETSLPPLPNLDMTIAPKDDLLILPQDQTTRTEQSATQTQNNNQSPDFSPPSGWGKVPVDNTPKVEFPEYPENEDQEQKEKKESGLTRFVKIFLISVALVLLGVLLGVLASSFLGGASTVNVVETPIPTKTDSATTPVASQSSQTDIQIEPDYSQKIEYRNSGAGPYSFDLLLTDDWKIATKSTEPRNLNLDIENQDLFAQITYNAKQSTPKPSLCLLSEEIAPKNIPYIKYQQIDELKMGELSWRLVKSLTSTQSASYLVCEQNRNNQYTNLTSVGFINFGLTSGEEISLNHKNTILKLLKGLEMVSPASPSAVKR